jgi:hypothetical protein
VSSPIAFFAPYYLAFFEQYPSQIDIIEVISDALYSDSEAVIDAAAELLDTLLKKNAEDAASMESLSLVSSFMQNADASASAAGLLETEEAMKVKEAERDAILSELVSAVGLQRLRFDTGMKIVGLAQLSLSHHLCTGYAHCSHRFSLFCILFSREQQQAQQRADVLRGSRRPLLLLPKVRSNPVRWAAHRMVCWSCCSREQLIHLYMFVAFVWRPSRH